jgi:anti-anti-sigma regulatory factor
VIPMRITTDVNTSGVAILAVAGRLCADTADGLTAAVAAAVHGHQLTRLVLDLARVGDADENAINALLQGHTHYDQTTAGHTAPSPSPLDSRTWGV